MSKQIDHKCVYSR